MTTQEEAKYIHDLLPELVREPIGYDLIEYEFLANPDVVEVMANCLEAKGLVKIPDPRNPFHLNLTTKGKEIAERPDGYLERFRSQCTW